MSAQALTDPAESVQATAPVVTETTRGTQRPRTSQDGVRGLLHRLPDSRVLAAVPVLLSVLAVHYPFAPGLISADTNSILYEAQSGHFRDWYTPFGSGVFWLADHLQISLSSLFWIQTGLMALGLYLLVTPPLRRLYGGLCVGAIFLFPPMYAQLSDLSRDSFCLALTLLAFGLLRRALTLRGSWRYTCMGLSVASALFAGLWRQNGVLALVGVVGILVTLGLRDGSGVASRFRRRGGRVSPRLRRLIAIVAGGVVGVSVLLVSGAVYRASGVEQTYPQRQLWVYDLAGISVRTHHDAFPSTIPQVVPNRQGVIPPNISESGLIQLFDPTNVLPLYYPSGNWARGLDNTRLDRSEETELFSLWRRAVLDSPLSYLDNHAQMLSSQLGFSQRPLDAFVGLMQTQNYGHVLEHPAQYRTAQRYLNIFLGADAKVPLDLTWPYLLLATVSFFLIRRLVTKDEAMVLAWMLAVTWIWILEFGVVAVGSSFRYSVLAVPVGLVFAVLAVRYRVGYVRDRASGST